MSPLRPLHIESRTVRDSARGEPCTLEIMGVCNRDPATTVLAHLPDDSNGMGRKSDDISACYACSACHAVIDGPSVGWPQGEYAMRHWYFRRAQTRTLRRMIEKGVVTIRGLELAHDEEAF